MAVAIACSSRKKAPTNRVTHNFLAYYNTLFNGKEALETELNTRNKNHQDNFYKPYIQLFTFENEAEATEEENPTPRFAAGFNAPAEDNNPKGAKTLEIAEAKALKAIENHSVMKDGEERNKMMFEAYLILAQARMYQGKYLEALDAINFILSHMKQDKRLPLAQIYEGRLYSKMKDEHRADEIFKTLQQADIKKKYRGLLNAFYAENLLAQGQKEEAVEALSQAYADTKNRNLRSRIAFLRGQILASLGKNEEARESFATAYQKSNNFEFEVKSQIEIAKTFNASTDDYEGAKRYLESLSKKGTYASRKNEFYYALGLMALRAGKDEEAQQFFEKALKEKASDGQIRGLTYYEIGKKYLSKDDYIAAGSYYDSAVAAMTYRPQKEELEKLSSNIKKLSKNYYLIKKNDSILALTKMDDAQKQAFFNTHIERLKQQEAQEEARLKAEKNQDFSTVEFASSLGQDQQRGFVDFGQNTSKGFYFANTTAVSKGEANFKQIWGDRALADNWRYSAKTNTIEDLRNQALGKTETKNPRRFEAAFYMEQIPTNADEIAHLKQERDTATLALGQMYEDYFDNTPLATKTLMDLVKAQPEDQVKLQALYQVFSMNYDKDPAAAEEAKELILKDFPYTPYAEFVRNPKRKQLMAGAPEVVQAYENAFQLYNDGAYEDSKALIDKTLEQYPNDALVPKLTLLNAYNTGKTVGKEVMILQLQQIALNYEKLPEGAKAQQLLNYLKSELEQPQAPAQATPNKIPQNNIKTAEPEPEVPSPDDNIIEKKRLPPSQRKKPKVKEL